MYSTNTYITCLKFLVHLCVFLNLGIPFLFKRLRILHLFLKKNVTQLIHRTRQNIIQVSNAKYELTAELLF